MPVVLRQLTHSLDAWTANGLRYPFASLFFWPLLLYAYRQGMLTTALMARCAIPALMAFGGQVFWAQAPYHLPASSIAFFIRMATAWAVVGAMVLFREERILLKSSWFWWGLILSLVGFVSLAQARGAFHVAASATGVAIMSACSLFFGLYGVSVKACLQGAPGWLCFGVVAQYVSLGTLIGMAYYGDLQTVHELDAFAWTLILTSSIIGVGIGHILLYNAVRLLGAAMTSALQTLVPLLTFSLAWLFLGEQMTSAEWIAGTVMLLGAGSLVKAQVQPPTE